MSYHTVALEPFVEQVTSIVGSSKSNDGLIVRVDSNNGAGLTRIACILPFSRKKPLPTELLGINLIGMLICGNDHSSLEPSAKHLKVSSSPGHTIL